MQFTVPPDDECVALAAHIEEGFQQAERGELIDGDEARHEIQMMKNRWLREFSRRMKSTPR